MMNIHRKRESPRAEINRDKNKERGGGEKETQEQSGKQP